MTHSANDLTGTGFRRSFTALGFLCALLPVTSNAQTASPITGHPRVIDGDTLAISGTHIRLHGIDAPESRQTCKDESGKTWACGREATKALKRIIGRQRVSCQPKDIDRYKRVVAVCYVGGPTGIDVNAAMVEGGWALAYRRYSKDYIRQEEESQRGLLGLWRGTFDRPWKWRAAQRGKHGKRLRGTKKTDASQCLIKGNIGRRGVRIYHVPGGTYYSRTKISSAKGERWFCSEAEARAAGWRKARR